MKKQAVIRFSAALFAALVAGANHVQAQTLSCPQQLFFGDYITCGAANSSTIAPNNTRSTTGCLNAIGSPFNAAQCNVSQIFDTALPGFHKIQLSITATKYNMVNKTGVKMIVDNFQCRFQTTSTTVTGNCLHTSVGAAFMLVDIGARLNVKNPQASGSYSGSFTVNAILQ